MVLWLYLQFMTSKMSALIHKLSALSLTKVYTKNFILTSSIDKILKIYKNPMNINNVYIHDNEKYSKISDKNLTDIDIVCLHCEDDPVIPIDHARSFIKNINSDKVKLIEFSNQGHSLTDNIIKECIKQSNILCLKSFEKKVL